MDDGGDRRVRQPGFIPGGMAEAAEKAAGYVADAAQDLADATRSYLASEEGRELRRRIASAVIVGAPVIAQLPILRRSPMGRLVRTAAVAGVVVRAAEWLRDWEPVEGR